MKIIKINIIKFIASVIIATAIMLIISCSKDEQAPTPVSTPKIAIKIGDQFAGGVVFFVEPNGENGLMTYQNDLIVGGETFANAIVLCDYFQTTQSGDPKIYDDWYLPTVVELQKLYSQRLGVGGFIDSYYWSSQEEINDINLAYYVNFYPNQGNSGKSFRTQKFSVRPIRKF